LGKSAIEVSNLQRITKNVHDLQTLAEEMDLLRSSDNGCATGAAPAAPSQQRGLTILEVMIAVAILGVILAIGIPSYAHISISNRLTSDTNALVAGLQFARSEAITRGEAVTVCVANAGLDACSGGGDWTSGWVILDAAANPIRVHPPLTENLAAEVNVQNGVGAVVFNRNGFSTNSRTIRLCGPRGDTRRIRGVVVSPDGRVRLAADLNGNGVVEDQDGNDLGC
jgi:type IV fimbrial biogenesis protein FimT